MRILSLEEMQLVSGGKGGSKRTKLPKSSGGASSGGASSGKASSGCHAGSGSSSNGSGSGGGSSSSNGGGCTPPDGCPG